MSLPRGRFVPISPGRRFVQDIMHFARAVPVVVVERRAIIPEVATARAAADPRPGWYPIFLKAFGLAAKEVPDLRRSLMSFPWPRLYEHACSVAAVTMERELDGEPAVFILQVRQPECSSLLEMDAQLKQAKTASVWDVAAFRRVLRMARLPSPIRRSVWWLGLRASPGWRQKYFGTFAASSTVTSGAETTAALTPLTSYFTFGEVDTEGRVTLRLMFDHRVTDAAPMARALAAMERALKTDILAELRGRVPTETRP